jgi:hypothetical protein
MALPVSAPLSQPFRFFWILDRRKDLVFYLGSALAGWLYVGVIAYAVHSLANPLTDPLATLRLGGLLLPLTLELLVVTSWAYVLDAPHVWATLARTLCDPDEWQERPRELLTSFGFFLIGPLLILLPYAIGALSALFGRYLSAGQLALGATSFFAAFRFWAYYHVVRQHWGFFALYRRKAGELAHDGLDYWFFNLTMYAPLVLFLTSSFYPQTPGYPDLGLHHELRGTWSLADVLYPLAWSAYGGILLLYLARQLSLWRAGTPLNASKLLYMALIVPLHLVAFSHPVAVVFVVPLVTVGHNIQYLCIVYAYGRRKYSASAGPRYQWARALFKSVAAYMLVGFLFTFALYRGPWIDWLGSITGLRLDQVLLNALGMMAGVKDPAALGLGAQVFAALILGFAMQHYYLDAKIWRVSRDAGVRRHLGL